VGLKTLAAKGYHYQFVLPEMPVTPMAL